MSVAWLKRGGGWVKCCSGSNPNRLQRLALVHRGERRGLVVVGGGVVLALGVDAHEAVELDHLAGGAENRLGGLDIDGSAIVDRRVHLARYEAVEDERVERQFVLTQVSRHRFRIALDRSRANRLMGVLGGLGGAVENCPLGDIFGAVAIDDVLAYGVQRLVGDPRRVGAHISDKADRALVAQLDALVQALRDPHRARGREVELARGLLLQARSDERRRRRAPHLLALDLADDEGLLLAGGDDLARLGLGQLVGLVIDTLVAMAVEAGLERGRIACLQTRVERPVFFGPKRLTFLLALDDYPQRHRLDPSGADSALDLVPQERTYLVADQPVEHAARLLGVEEVVIELLRIGHRVAHRALRYLMEQHAPNGALDLSELVGDVPRDGLALAVRVGREIYMIGLLGLGLDFLEHLRLARDDVVLGLEIVVDSDAKGALGQIHHVADRRDDLKVGAQIALDGFRLGRRFYYDEVFCHPCLQPPETCPRAARQLKGRA